MTVYADTTDADLASSSGTYANARDGTGNPVSIDSTSTDTSVKAGQTLTGGTRFVWQAFEAFDTSSIPDGDVVMSASLQLYGVTDQSSTEFTLEARAKDWGAAVDTGDWTTGAGLASLARLATFDTTPGWSTAGYNTFTEDGANFRNGIDKAGTTRMVLVSNRSVGSGVDPIQNERVYWYTSDQAGTTNDPKLVIVHEPKLGGAALLTARL